MKPTQSKPGIVFCNGFCADGSCFNKVLPMLQGDGHQVIAAQYGFDTFAGDAATVRRTPERVSRLSERANICNRARNPQNSLSWANNGQPGSYQFVRQISTDKRACVH